MAKIYFVFSIALGMISSGCRGTGLFDFDNRPTQVNALPVKTALKDSAAIIRVPLIVAKKQTGGFRSMLDLQVDVMLTEPDGIDVPLIPNGGVVGPRVRW